VKDLYELRVFTDTRGNYGDRASVIVDVGRHISDSERMDIARKLGTGETAFINNLVELDVSIVHPQGEIDFAGVALLGAAAILEHLGVGPVTTLRTRSGAIKTWTNSGLVWARSSPTHLPPWNLHELQNVEAVDQMSQVEGEKMDHTVVWSWLDQDSGRVRARTFASDWEIPEAQGNGSGAMVLASVLGRSIEIRHGNGSVMFAVPAEAGQIDVGGRIVLI
jgi:predicted PhzF superfamily epimerase YddE/YHI9